MNVLLIGGTGFISSRLVGLLLDKGHHVTIFTRGKTRSRLPESDRLEYRHGDRREAASLRKAASGRTYDAVYDMVAYAPSDTLAAIEAFRGRTGRFIHCSTISVYMISSQVRNPVTENQDTLPLMQYDPRNPFGMDYGIEKRRCEDLLWKAHDEKAFPVTVLRPTFVSGPHDPTLRDFFWIERILDGQPLLVPGSGDFAFQQVFVDDAAHAFASVLQHPDSAGQAYNVAAEEIMTLNEYLHALSRLLERTPECIHVDQQVFDVLPFSTSLSGDVFPFNTRRTAIFSLEKIKQDLKYRSASFERWMRDTIEWYTTRQNRHSIGYEHREAEVSFARYWQQLSNTRLRDAITSARNWPL